MGTVLVGGLVGAAGREAVAQALPTAPGAFPVATFVVNAAGAFVLGALLELLVRAGGDHGWRHRVRLVLGTGALGAFTTYSTFAVEAVDLARHRHLALALAYVVASLAAGLLAAGLGIGLVAGGDRARIRALPVDPDPDELEAGR